MSKKKLGFSPPSIYEWKKDDGLSFSVALARLTGWLIHVNWWTPNSNREILNLDEVVPLRIHVEDDCNNIYDFEAGKKQPKAFNEYYIWPLLEKKKLHLKGGGVSTDYYSEDQLKTLPLRSKPNEASIIKATNLITENIDFLSKIPKRLNKLPAELAAKYSFGKCAMYCHVLASVTGKKEVAIIARKYNETFGLSKIGFCHSVLLHDTTIVEDSWGIRNLDDILKRYGVVEYDISEEYQANLIRSFKEEHPEEYEKQYNEILLDIKMANDYII